MTVIKTITFLFLYLLFFSSLPAQTKSAFIIGLHPSTRLFLKQFPSSTNSSHLLVSSSLPVTTDRQIIDNMAQALQILENPNLRSKHKKAASRYYALAMSSKVDILYKNARHYRIKHLEDVNSTIYKINYRLSGKIFTAFALRRSLVFQSNSLQAKFELRGPNIFHDATSRIPHFKTTDKNMQKIFTINSDVPFAKKKSLIKKLSFNFSKIMDPRNKNQMRYYLNTYLQHSHASGIKYLKPSDNSIKVQSVKKLRNGISKITYCQSNDTYTGYTFTCCILE